MENSFRKFEQRISFAIGIETFIDIDCNFVSLPKMSHTHTHTFPAPFSSYISLSHEIRANAFCSSAQKYAALFLLRLMLMSAEKYAAFFLTQIHVEVFLAHQHTN